MLLMLCGCFSKPTVPMAEPDACTFEWGDLVRLDTVSDAAADELGAWLAPDGLTIWFSRVGTPGVLVASRASTEEAFGMPDNVALAQADADGEVALSDDGLEIWFNRYLSNFDIVHATRATPSGTFGNYTPEIDLGKNEASATFTADRLELVLAVNDVGNGNTDLYVAKRAAPGAAFTTALLLDNINTLASDERPAITGDGLTLYFASWRTAVTRVYYATRPDRDSQFSSAKLFEPTNLEVEMTSPAVTLDGNIVVVSAKMSASYDLYAVTRSCR